MPVRSRRVRARRQNGLSEHAGISGIKIEDAVPDFYGIYIVFTLRVSDIPFTRRDMFRQQAEMLGF